VIVVDNQPTLSGLGAFSGGEFGTLRSDSTFTPGQVLDEATQLQNAIMALAQIQFNAGTASADQLAQWNAFVSSWSDFWQQCNGILGWFFRAKDSTRDELLDFERQYAVWQATLGGSNLPTPTPEAARTPDNLASAVDSLIKIPGQNLIGALGPWLVLGGVGLGLYAFRKPIMRAIEGVA